jgi:hypothetical protein
VRAREIAGHPGEGPNGAQKAQREERTADVDAPQSESVKRGLQGDWVVGRGRPDD